MIVETLVLEMLIAQAFDLAVAVLLIQKLAELVWHIVALFVPFQQQNERVVEHQEYSVEYHTQ